jgi:hypothetical protein
MCTGESGDACVKSARGKDPGSGSGFARGERASVTIYWDASETVRRRCEFQGRVGDAEASNVRDTQFELCFGRHG